MPKTMTPSQINQVLRKCQKQLRLSDWDIDLEVVDSFPSQRVAECQWSVPNMSAIIRILNPKYNTAKGIGMQDVRATLYHELLHIIITPIVKDVEADEHEQAIERVAKALAGI